MTVQEFKELLEDVAERIESDAHQLAQLTAENERLNLLIEKLKRNREMWKSKLLDQRDEARAENERLLRVVEPLLEKHESEDRHLSEWGDDYKRGWYSAMRNVRERLAQLKGDTKDE